MVQYKGVLVGGERGNNQMILGTYLIWWFDKWSGWRDLKVHSTLNPILKLSYVNSITSNSQFTFV